MSLLLFLRFAIFFVTSVRAITLDVHEQCQAMTYAGACIEAPLDGVYPMRCGTLLCAEAVGDGTYNARGIGRALDGTYCGSRKACSNGKCRLRTRKLSSYGKDARFHCKGLPSMISYAKPKSKKCG